MKSSHNYLFVSDLHLSEGRDPQTGILSANEDFFHDDAFASFLAYHVALCSAPAAAAHYRKPWKLVINGDFFDFLQVTTLPAEGEALYKVKKVRQYTQLTPNEREYGLGTSSPEIVWKLEQIAKGHPTFFQALGWFLAQPNQELVILKGNHDIEVYWTAVQERFRELVAEAYQNWWQGCRQGSLVDSLLTYHANMPADINQLVAHQIHFPAWFYYEPNLFYAEHGNQYDPANAFTNFLEPVLPDKERIELPSGSFFVRYFFNKVEQIHPFADNLKPITRYIRWAVQEEPVDTLKMVISRRQMMVKSLQNLLKKRANPIKGMPNLERHKGMPKGGEKVALHEERWQQLMAVRDEFQHRAEVGGNQTSQMTVGSLGLSAGMNVAILVAIRAFVKEQWGKFWFSLLAVAGCFVGRTVLGQKLNEFDSLISLADVAEAIAKGFNQPDSAGNPATVPYYIFGHDHNARMKKLISSVTHAPNRQWYVNTGCWLPSFSETDRLTRGDVQLAFFRLVPDMPHADEQPPELLEWMPGVGHPQPIKILH